MEVNDTEVNYHRYNGNVLRGLHASTILRSPMSMSPNPSMTRTDRQQFVFDQVDLEDGSNQYFLPVLGDIIEIYDTGERFEAIQEDEDLPCYRHITADRSTTGGRVMIFTQRMAAS